jgi:hypothetical protein
MANYLTVVHECKDYPSWKKAYDADAPNRAAAGLTEICGKRRRPRDGVLRFARLGRTYGEECRRSGSS